MFLKVTLCKLQSSVCFYFKSILVVLENVIFALKTPNVSDFQMLLVIIFHRIIADGNHNCYFHMEYIICIFSLILIIKLWYYVEQVLRGLVLTHIKKQIFLYHYLYWGDSYEPGLWYFFSVGAPLTDQIIGIKIFGQETFS